ncbi:ATP-dependent Clp protease ATP-binding subunit [Emticicia sp. 17c]|uniref:ATP-dependent Clp protease ATP-binding subunit n=1 Tax=Emticicia sp. 17c TaxID=3127704 RepID=UPI00301E056C
MKFSETSQRAIQIAQIIAKEFNHAQFSAAHLLKALLHEEIGLSAVLIAQGKDIHYLRDWAEVRIEELPRTKAVENPTADALAKKALEGAEIFKIQYEKNNIDAWCVLAAIVKPNMVFKIDELSTLSITSKEVIDAMLAEDDLIAAVSETPATTTNTKTATDAPRNTGKNAVHKFCINKTELAKEEKIDPIIGRDNETRHLIEYLGRRSKPNVIITGEPGVGKTALVDGLALNIVQGKVPNSLKNAQLLELDTGALVAGASYKGEVEDRIKNIIREVKQFEKAILFIDEIHVLLDSKGSIGNGVAQLLKPELARGELTVIGATTNEEYQKFIEKDDAFARRFGVLRIEEPDIDSTARMLQHILPKYETHHNLKLKANIPVEAARLAKRYLPDRRLPDSAIDLIDRTMASVAMVGETSEETLRGLQKELEELISKKEELGEKTYLTELAWFKARIKNKISPILVNKSQEFKNVPETAADFEAHLTEILNTLIEVSKNKKEWVEEDDIAITISTQTGIPTGKLQSQEKEKLAKIGEILKSRVVGQDHAIEIIAKSLNISRAGLLKGKQPIGSFFFLGSTGTGKTELAKSLADFLFNDESFMIRFDMSEFKEEHSASLLLGAPPGYVGYEEGGLLVNRIRQKPYSVVLFDEIEKAHKSVFDIFLNVLDEGRVKDKLDKVGDFSNAIIIFTSNIGAEFIVNHFKEGKTPEHKDLLKIMQGHFRPEFLQRINTIIPFAPISEEMATKIFEIQLKGLVSSLNQQGINFEMDKEAIQALALSDFTSEYGARQIKGIIRNELMWPISQMIINGEIQGGQTLTVSVTEDKKIDWKITGEPTINNPEI